MKRISKKVIISSAVIILLGLTVVLLCRDTDDDIVYSPAPISQSKRDQLDADFAKINKEYVPDWCTEDNIYGDCRIYGEDNGYILFFYWGGMRMQAVVTKDIGGVEFYHPMSFSFYAYKDGVFIKVEDAYNQGLISHEALVTAQKYHQEAAARYNEGRQKEMEEYLESFNKS